MTATRIGWAATLAAAIGLWLFAASLLWRTSVPSNLDLPKLHSRDFLTPAVIHRAEHFSDVLTWLSIGTIVTQIAVLALIVWLAPRLSEAFPVGRIGQGVLVGLFAGVMVWLALIPFDLAITWWGRRYDLVLDGYGVWATDQWGLLTAEAVGTTLLMVVFMSLAGKWPRTWWIPASGVFVVVGMVLAFALPYNEDTHPITDPELKASIHRIEQREGLGHVKVAIQDVSGHTTAANAFTEGLGPSERVVLWDTLVDNYSPRQVTVVVAHELGHVKSKHILKGIAWSVLVLLPALFVIALVTRRRGGMARPAAVPLALLTLAALNLVIALPFNEVSRRYEAEADWRALNASRDPQAAIGLFKDFSKSDLAEPNPPVWDYLLFENHPTVLQRIAMVKAWQARNKQP